MAIRLKFSCHGYRLEALPYKSWPNDPAEGESTEFETGIDALARHTNHSCLHYSLPVSCRSSFVNMASIAKIARHGQSANHA